LNAWTSNPEGDKARPEEFADDMRLMRVHCDFYQRLIVGTERNVQGEKMYVVEKAMEAEE
jgi:hypothetical protein